MTTEFATSNGLATKRTQNMHLRQEIGTFPPPKEKIVTHQKSQNPMSYGSEKTGNQDKRLNTQKITKLRTLRCLVSLKVLLGVTLNQPALSNSRTVIGSVYHPYFHGRITYCGSVYQHWGVSAAHPWLPCGTKVRVSHKGRSVTVPITDRCDCNSIDLSAGAAYRLGIPLNDIRTVSISY